MVEFLKFMDGWIGVCGDLAYIVTNRYRGFTIATREGFYALASYPLKLDDLVFDPRNWFEEGPLTNFCLFKDLDDMVNFVKKGLARHVASKKIAISFSGGKDSTLALAIMTRICEELGCKVYAIYVHMPFIEPLHYVREVERIAKSLNTDVLIVEPPRKLVKAYLLKEGLPYRRARWCTYLKTRKLREVAKREIKAELIVVGDRIWENLKRFSRLTSLIIARRFVKKGSIYPVALATFMDVVKALDRLHAIHKAYLSGCIRVSCTLCPYKSIVELSTREPYEGLEDPGFVYEVLRREWKKWYVDVGIDFESLENEALWRFVPRVAKLFLKVKEYARRFNLLVTNDEVRKEIASNWARRECMYVDPKHVLKLIEYVRLASKEPFIDITSLIAEESMSTKRVSDRCSA